MVKLGITSQDAASLLRAGDMPVLQALSQNASLLAQSVEQGFVKLSQIFNMNFLGLDLSMTPTWKPKILFGAETWKTYVPLLILPVLTLATTMLSMRVARRTSFMSTQTKEEKEREKNNPAKAGQTPNDQGAGMMRTMEWLMPIIMLTTIFAYPAALGLYWVIGNLMAILQSALTYFFYTKPVREARAREKDKYDRRVRQVPATAAADAGGGESLATKTMVREERPDAVPNLPGTGRKKKKKKR